MCIAIENCAVILRFSPIIQIYLNNTFYVPTDSHSYKIVEKLKQLKPLHLPRHVSVHAGTIIREQSRA
jgi:hypothetical protein